MLSQEIEQYSCIYEKGSFSRFNPPPTLEGTGLGIASCAYNCRSWVLVNSYIKITTPFPSIVTMFSIYDLKNPA